MGALVRGEDALSVLRMEKPDEEVGVLLPRLGRVAEQRLDLRARVEVRADGVDRVDVDDERELLDERAVPELRRAQSLLAERAVAKVPDPGGEDRRPVDRKPPDRDLDRELLAVRALCGQLDPRVEDPARAVGRAVGRPARQAAAVRLAHCGRHDQLGELPPERLLAGVPEDLLRRVVELEDAPPVVDRDERVESRRDRRGGMGAPDRRSARAACRGGRTGRCPHARTPRAKGHRMDIALQTTAHDPYRGTPNGGTATVSRRDGGAPGRARRRGSTPTPSGAS